MKKPMIGISSCLLGNNVRYNGGHTKDKWIVNDLSSFVDWHVVCPEVAMGLGVPREPINLHRPAPGQGLRLVSVDTKIDLTDAARLTSKSLIEAFPENLAGFIFKKNSPTCGLTRVKVYQKGPVAQRDGTGIFAGHVQKNCPGLPVIEEGHLFDRHLREHFISQVFTHARFLETPKKISALQGFHQGYKYLIMAYSAQQLKKMGRIAANTEKKQVSEVFALYHKELLKALAKPATVKMRTNALQHIFGHVKDCVSKQEKDFFIDKLHEYRKGDFPYIALITLLNSFVDKGKDPYVKKQQFFSPYPKELKLDHYL